MIEEHKNHWIFRRTDRLGAFADDPPLIKIQALRIIEVGDTVRFTIRLLLGVITVLLLKF